MKIAIDAMGGDNAPKEIVEGAIAAANDNQDIEIVLVGNKQAIQAIIGEQKPSNLSIIHADEVIESDDEPVKAVRRKKNSSMVVAGKLVKDGDADAMLSAGNTGALMTTGLLIVGRIAGIERPALAPLLPSLDKVGMLALDLGANMDATAEQLMQYAVMGSIYREKVEGLKNPRIGLLNVGSEEMKGNEVTKAAYSLLKESNLNFIGSVESKTILNRECDVLVCDGFSGNIMLKSYEGAASVIFNELKKAFKLNFLTKLAAAVMLPKLKGLKKTLDPNEFGGAPLLGLNGLVLKIHGSSDSRAVQAAVKQAKTAVSSGLIASIKEEINKERS
ncbi:MAG: phosphate acyltransferase PlsX [Candidatus Pristimantibacillus lignocellulolyticus]|uniref:Phosphate acyltransferase n=1 Tax=Candidatus Pristimantibacillus lignocellulolyticus TaxID=2994561 RepID=A0A9J6ZBZ1_9BACL|nr:MAG: phosphate acyltransferase PlsX [Candidatus Pristimantibacillus lignocellulolyticus]